MPESLSVVFADASGGSARARAELHRRYLPFVVRRLRSRAKGGLRRSFDTTDLAQSVFHEVLRDLPRIEYRGERAFHNWLMIKAENKVRSKFRKKMWRDGGWREAPLPESMDRRDSGPGPMTTVRKKEEAARLREALARLKPGYREIILLRQDEGRTYQEVADDLGLASADAARMKHARALLALRRLWKTP